MSIVAQNTAKVWAAAIGHWLVLSLLSVAFYPMIVTDTYARYAPMAEAFAAGDFFYAFSPRFGVLFQTVAGCVAWLTGLDGVHSSQVAAIGFLSLSAVPLWLTVRRIFGEEIAWWAIVLFLVSDDMTRYAMDGLRDSGKCLGYALVAFGAVRAADKPDFRSALSFGLGLFVLVTIFSYCFAVAAALLFAWGVWHIVRKDADVRLAVLQIAVPVFLFALGTAAVTYMTHFYTGHWVPAPHYIRILGGWL